MTSLVIILSLNFNYLSILNIFYFKDKYSIGSICVIILICIWHAILSIIDNLASYNNIFGVQYLTLDEYNFQKNQTSLPITTYIDEVTKQTMIAKNLITFAEKCDRVIFVIFIVVYIFFQFSFALWMYFSVNNLKTYKLKKIKKFIHKN